MNATLLPTELRSPALSLCVFYHLISEMAKLWLTIWYKWPSYGLPFGTNGQAYSLPFLDSCAIIRLLIYMRGSVRLHARLIISQAGFNSRLRNKVGGRDESMVGTFGASGE